MIVKTKQDNFEDFLDFSEFLASTELKVKNNTVIVNK